MSGWDRPVSVEDLFDVDTATARLAAQAPWWEPGTASGYHALNQGHLLGEVLRRITGITLRDFVAQEIAAPLGADFQIGAKESDWDRVSPLSNPPDLGVDLVAMLGPDHLAVKTFGGPAVAGIDANRPEWRNTIIGAANGHGNARSVARILSAITLGGTVDGVRLLSEKTIEQALAVRVDDVDQVLMVPVRRGLGFALAGAATAPGVPADGRIAFWGGWGGSLIFMDLDRRMTFSYVMNKMGSGILGNERSLAYLATSTAPSADLDHGRRSHPAPAHCYPATSITVADPIPPPHTVTRRPRSRSPIPSCPRTHRCNPDSPPRLRSSWTRVTSMRAPVAATG